MYRTVRCNYLIVIIPNGGGAAGGGGKEKKITNFPKIEEGKNKKYIELPVPYRSHVGESKLA